jgi:hypothetical protein
LTWLALRAALKQVPREVWYALAIAVAIAGVRYWYHRQIIAAEVRGYTRAIEEGRKVAQQTDSKTGTITIGIRSKTDEANSRVVARADDQRLRGPGAARCAPVSAPSGEHQPIGGKPDAAGPRLPTDDRAAVPWEWLVQRAEQCDLNRNEVLAWREWHQKVLEAWPK